MINLIKKILHYLYTILNIFHLISNYMIHQNNIINYNNKIIHNIFKRKKNKIKFK